LLRRSFLFLAGVAAGYFLAPPEPRYQRNFTGAEKEDWNYGKPGVIYHYVDGQLKAAEEDRNYDGKPDAWYKYTAGKLRYAEYDNNFDGRPDVWVTFKDKFNYEMREDTDFNGKPDRTIFFVNDLMQKVDWYPKDSPIIERRELYEHGILKEKLVDTDGDGIFDLRIAYDSYERPIGETKVSIPT
jgi:hypothetical protein